VEEIDEANKLIAQLRQAIWEFYQKYYYASNMTLTVLW
jgi:predicted Zn-dependent peptidase